MVRRRLALLVAYGPEARAFLQSGLADRLGTKWEVVVATPEPASPAFAGRREPVLATPACGEAPIMQRVRGWSRGVRRRAPALAAVSLCAERASGRFWGGGAWARFWSENAVEAVIAASATGARTLPALQAAANRGMQTAVLLNSWKDLRGGGELPVPVDAVGVVTENERAAPGTKAAVEVCGSLHQAAVRRARAMSRHEFCRAVALDAARPIVLYAAAANDAIEPARALRLAAQLREMSSRPQLLIRPNPMDDFTGLYDALAEREGAAVLHPKWEWRRDREWNCPLPEDLPWWRAAIEHSALAVALPSTIALDFAAWGKPTVNVAWGPAARLWEADPYSPVRKTETVLAARSPDDCAGLVQRLLAQPARLPVTRSDAAEMAFRLIGRAFPPAPADSRTDWARSKAVAP